VSSPRPADEADEAAKADDAADADEVIRDAATSEPVR
jgi:hypothetical protein